MANNLVLFDGADAAGDESLWATDGTGADTAEITGVSGANAGGLEPSDLAAYHGEALFKGRDAAGVFGLWETDGTAAGTHELTPVAGANSRGLFFNATEQSSFTILNDEVLFGGYDATGDYGLWETNGTAAGTSELVALTNAGSAMFAFSDTDFTVLGGVALFVSYDSAGVYGLWTTNGTAAGTTEITGISGAAPQGVFLDTNSMADFTVLGGEALFDGTDAAFKYGLWTTNGTAAGTFELTAIAGANSGGVNPSDMTVLNGAVIFEGTDAAGAESLWTTNGTAAGTQELTGISGAYAHGLFPTIENPDFTVFDGEALFEGYDTADHYGLWVTNGTAAGTHEITGVSGAYSGGLFSASAAPSFTVAHGEVLFEGYDTADKRGLWVTDGTAAGTRELTGVVGPDATGLNPADITAFPAIVADDFNGDGRSDILFLNPDGALAQWQLDDTQVIGGGVFQQLGAGWTVAGTGDFDGSGRTGVLLSTAAGALAIWELNGGTVVGGGPIGQLSAGWSVAGEGDFNGDNMSDLLLVNASGAVAEWDMTGPQVTGGGAVGQLSGGWSVAAIGDFNGDGKSDLLLQNAAGAVAEWLLNGATVIGGGVIGQLSSGWSVVGAGDFNGDGKSDLLLESAAGALAEWQLNGAAVIGGGAIGSLGAGWSFVAAGDFNGDGKSDLLLHNASGETATWDMNGAGVIGGGAIGTIGSPWIIEH